MDDDVVDLLSEQVLKFHLLARSYPEIAPAEPVTLKYGISPVKIVDVDVRRGLVTVDLWLKHYWEDPRLVWDPTVYSSKILFFKANDEVFVPEMALYNGVMTPTAPDPLVVVNPNGGMIYFPTVRVEIYCRLPSLPFHDVICPITIGPWSHDTRQTVLATFDPAVETTFVQDTGICIIGDSWAEIRESSYDCCPGIEFGTMTLYLRLNCSDDDLITPATEVQHRVPKKAQALPLASTSKCSLPIVAAPFLVLLIFMLPYKATNRVFLGTLVFAALLLVWTSSEVSPDERRFLQLSTMVAISATFASLVPCIFSSVGKQDTQIRDYGTKQSWCKNRVAIMIDLMLFAAAAIVLGISTAGTFA